MNVKAYTAQNLGSSTPDTALEEGERSNKSRTRHRSSSYVTAQRRHQGRDSAAGDHEQFEVRAQNIETGSHTARLRQPSNDNLQEKQTNHEELIRRARQAHEQPGGNAVA